MMDLSSPELSYMVGLLQTDGTHSGSTTGKGKISIELAERDADILLQLQRLLPCHSLISTRIRDTNFKQGYASRVLEFCAQDVRKEFERFGVPTGKKSKIIGPPTETFSRSDYLRGVLDGDGSIGFTAKGFPFISLVTASPAMAKHFCDEIAGVSGVRRSAKPNKRDSVPNIMVANLAAVRLADWCYPVGALSIARKYAAARAVSEWLAPHQRFGHTMRHWTPEEDELLGHHTIKEAAALLGRTEQSVNLRRWRLRRRTPPPE
ncbi:hypothetical protein ACWDOP_19210 [Nocardia sp. NPDC003693]